MISGTLDSAGGFPQVVHLVKVVSDEWFTIVGNSYYAKAGFIVSPQFFESQTTLICFTVCTMWPSLLHCLPNCSR